VSDELGEEIDGWSDTAPSREKFERATEILRACLAEADEEQHA